MPARIGLAADGVWLPVVGGRRGRCNRTRRVVDDQAKCYGRLRSHVRIWRHRPPEDSQASSLTRLLPPPRPTTRDPVSHSRAPSSEPVTWVFIGCMESVATRRSATPRPSARVFQGDSRAKTVREIASLTGLYAA